MISYEKTSHQTNSGRKGKKGEMRERETKWNLCWSFKQEPIYFAIKSVLKQEKLKERRNFTILKWYPIYHRVEWNKKAKNRSLQNK